ncbi:E3 SUMO-protein ligase SIZ1-like [Pyrus ussuriensis x Pyrus communis]|uniref:E3 SUMO-protein ligase SIZ1-like n=1 Tax=Pyrus ussuriensis x Pyrus communis TaxID=2448454 RepID=A0A5N5F4V4_9ROSA|nr:E3 SUMO-protein ligase SIZ1-like [Pyrus ussuriensis x Pyrus communis]
MDVVAECKRKLASFRVKELKYVLTQLGMSKQGRKQDLVDRILAEVSDQHRFLAASNALHSSKKKIIEKKGVAELIDEAYRKLPNTPSADSASKEQSGSDTCSVKPKREVKTFKHPDVKICCPCGSALSNGLMIQCVDSRCQVQQHLGCVIIPEETRDFNIPVRPLFYCELCRLKRADPFWVTVVDLLSPVKLVTSNIPIDGANPTQSVEKTFLLSRADGDLLKDNQYDVQAWCILLNDSVSFRMQWPQFADLQVNGVNVRTVNRPAHQLLGANGRDDGVLITLYIVEGINKISLSACDNRAFCLGVRLVKRRTVQQVLNLIPKEEDGELFEDALARIRRCIGGGPAVAAEDSDSDLEVISDSISVNLRCPMSGGRMKVAGRFKPCAHMGCFDLETFVELNQRSRKWQCPVCLKNYSVEDVIIDRYFNRITTMMRNCGEDIAEINVKPDGSWSAKTKGEFGDLAQWHLPDGSPCGDSDLEPSRKLKLESGLNEDNGIKCNWVTEVRGHQPDPLEEVFEGCSHNVITMSSSDSSANLDFSVNEDNEINSVPYNSDPTFSNKNSDSAEAGNADIIVLSDSEEEDANLVSSGTAYSTFPVSGTDPGFQYFGNVSGSFIDSTLVPADLNPSSQVMNSSMFPADAGLDLIENTLPFASEDPSLQNFLPTQPSALLEQSDSGQHPPQSNSISRDDWISLRLGRVDENVPNACPEHVSIHEVQLSNECGSDEATPLIKDGTDEVRSNKAKSRKFSDGPFSFPRQPRTLRQRVYLPVESNSE